jgi:Helix-turn-helix domain
MSTIENLEWALLPKSSKAVFPIVACYADKKGIAFPGQTTIAALCGLSVKAAIRGIRGLNGFCNFSINKKKRNGRGRPQNIYNIALANGSFQKSAFPFYKITLEYGLWHELTPAAKAVYPALRYLSYWYLV